MRKGWKFMKTTTKQKKRTLLMMALTVPFLLLSSTEYLPSAEAAGLYTPGEITDTTVAPGAADTVFGGAGTYNINNSADNTLTITLSNTANSSKSEIFSAGNVVVNGNLHIVQDGNLVAKCLVQSDSSLIMNGDFTSEKKLDADGLNVHSVETHRILGDATFNGDLNLEQEVVNTGTSTLGAVTTLIIKGGTTNLNGNVHLITKADGELTNGLNGLYVTDKAVLNITGANKNVFLQAVNKKSDVVSARNGAVVNINTGGTTQIIGNIDAKTSGVINAVFSGSDSFWYGDEISVLGKVNITLNDGAEWGYFGDNGVGVYHYQNGKGITNLTLNGGYVNLFDDYLKGKWQEYGLSDQYDDIMDFKHDYVYINDLKGDGGSFRLNLDSNDKSNSDMIYINKSTDDGAGYHYLQAHADDEFAGITADNTLRFATVGAAAADKISFHDTANVYGKKLWDYKLLIGSEDYDINDPENDIYNAKFGNASYVTGEGAKNWFIYNVIENPTGSVETAIGAGPAVYHMWRENDQIMKRMGDLRFNGVEEKGVWFRLKNSKISRNGAFGFDSKYRQYELGYDNVIKQTDKFTRYGGMSLSYTDMDNGYNQGSGDSDGFATNFYVTQIGSKGHYLDLVAKLQHIESDFTAVNKDGSKVTGDFDNTGISLSAEYGRKSALADSGWYIEPQVQLTLGYLGGSRYKTSNDLEVQQGSITSALGRLGFNIGKDINSKTNIYIKGSWMHEFGGSYKSTLHDYTGGDHVTIEQSYNDTWFEYGVGASIQTGKNNQIYFDVERSAGSDFKKDWNWNVGARWSF